MNNAIIKNMPEKWRLIFCCHFPNMLYFASTITAKRACLSFIEMPRILTLHLVKRQATEEVGQTHLAPYINKA
jgi:hypothetical protein